MIAVIEVNNKQFLVKEGDKIKIDSPTVGEVKVLLLAEWTQTNADVTQNYADSPRESASSQRKSALDVKIGAPYVEGVKAETKILKQGREKKKIIFRYHSKTRYRKKKGHRQHYTELEILGIRN